MKKKKHEFYMEKALAQASTALRHEEVPIGAIVVDNKGEIIARGYNKTEKKQLQTAHAEMIAIEAACKKISSWRLDEYSLYVTLEPCLMCFGLIHLSRIKNVYYGAHSNLFGFSLIEHKQTHTLVSAYKKEMNIVAGLKQKECTDILGAFFRKLRKRKRE